MNLLIIKYHYSQFIINLTKCSLTPKYINNDYYFKSVEYRVTPYISSSEFSSIVKQKKEMKRKEN